jgi:predicted dithiol-disulfide oxidoreductase (DUF899 family)
MGSSRGGVPGREATMPVRLAEASAVRRIIETRFGRDHVADKRWVICGDFNDYRQKIVISGDRHAGYECAVTDEASSSVDALLAGGDFGSLVCYLRVGDRVFQTYWTTGRGNELMAPTFGLLDRTVYGRQETWEDSPIEWTQSAPFEWWCRHDEYDQQ